MGILGASVHHFEHPSIPPVAQASIYISSPSSKLDRSSRSLFVDHSKPSSARAAYGCVTIKTLLLSAERAPCLNLDQLHQQNKEGQPRGLAFFLLEPECVYSLHVSRFIIIASRKDRPLPRKDVTTGKHVFSDLSSPCVIQTVKTLHKSRFLLHP